MRNDLSSQPSKAENNLSRHPNLKVLKAFTNWLAKLTFTLNWVKRIPHVFNISYIFYHEKYKWNSSTKL